MPSPIAHGSIVMLAQPALGRAFRESTKAQQVMLSLLALFACGAPDLDIFAGLIRSGDPFEQHGYQTHSLLVAPVFGIGFAVAAGAISPMFRTPLGLLRSSAIGAGLYGLHVVMDYLTFGSRGVGLFWPLIEGRYASPIGLFVGVEHGEWWLWQEHLLTVSTELVFAAVIWAIARRVKNGRRSGSLYTGAAS